MNTMIMKTVAMTLELCYINENYLLTLQIENDEVICLNDNMKILSPCMILAYQGDECFYGYM